MRRLQDFTFNVHDRKDSDDIFFFFGLILLCSTGVCVLAVMSISCSTSWVVDGTMATLCCD